MTTWYFINYSKHRFLKPALEAWPAAYIAVQKLRYRNYEYRNNLVDKRTDITIEGFPRCANSFAVEAFRHAHRDRSYKLAHHLHSYAQVIRSVQLNVPTICLIRKPEEAVVSVAAMIVQIEGIGVQTFVQQRNIQWYIEYYNRFYSRLLPYVDQLVIAPFPEVIKDFGSVIARVNEKYQTQFESFHHTAEFVEDFFANGRDHVVPSEKREKIKSEMKALIDTEACQRQLQKANSLYGEWMKAREKETLKSIALGEF